MTAANVKRITTSGKAILIVHRTYLLVPLRSTGMSLSVIIFLGERLIGVRIQLLVKFAFPLKVALWRFGAVGSNEYPWDSGVKRKLYFLPEISGNTPLPVLYHDRSTWPIMVSHLGKPCNAERLQVHIWSVLG